MSVLCVNGLSGAALRSFGRAVLLGAALTIVAACASNEPRPVKAAAEVPEVPDEREHRSTETDLVPEQTARSYERALEAIGAEDWVEAELRLEQFVLEYSEFPGAYVNLAIVYLRDGRTDEARQALEGALAIDPGFAPANNQLGVLLREEGEFAAAEAVYRAALERDPDYMLARYNLAILLDLYLRRAVEALEQYEIYRESLAEPDPRLERWIVELERRARASGELVASDE